MEELARQTKIIIQRHGISQKHTVLSVLLMSPPFWPTIGYRNAYAVVASRAVASPGLSPLILKAFAEGSWSRGKSVITPLARQTIPIIDSLRSKGLGNLKLQARYALRFFTKTLFTSPSISTSLCALYTLGQQIQNSTGSVVFHFTLRYTLRLLIYYQKPFSFTDAKKYRYIHTSRGF